VLLALASTFSLAAITGCGDDTSGAGGAGAGGEDGTTSTGGTPTSSGSDAATTTTGSSGGGGGGGGGGAAACGGADTTDCDVIVEPSDDDTTTLQEALIDGVDSGDTVCICPGTYSLEREVSLAVPNVTVRGVGTSREDVVLDFATQTQDDDGISVDSDGFTIENLTIKNSPGNGILVRGAERVTFRNLLVTWDAGPSVDNGAYAIYPVQCTDVLVEGCEVTAAADAGIYVGQSEGIIVRDNVVHGNVAGIEIENSDDADVYGNEAYDNTAGILIFVLPNLEKKDGNRTKVHDNLIYDNNRANFAVPGTVVANVPAGIGALVLAADTTEIHDNTFTNNGSTSMLLISYATIAAATGDEPQPDPGTDPYLSGVYIHDNELVDNGLDPRGLVLAIPPQVEDVLWDGIVEPDVEASLCLSESPPPFRNFNTLANLTSPEEQFTDTAPYECEGATVAAQDF